MNLNVPIRALLFPIAALLFLSSCGDFKRARSKRIVEKTFEHFENGDLEKALEAAELAVQLGSRDWKLYDARARLFYQLGRPEDSLESYDRAIEFLKSSEEAAPNYLSSLRYFKAEVTGVMARYPESVAEYEKSIEIDKENSQSLNNLAWLLAVAPEVAIRDGKRAVKLAEKACELTDWNEPASIDTLAAAHAEVGEFEKAVKYQKRVLEMLRAQKSMSEAQLKEMGFDERLSLFESGRPFRKDFMEEYKVKYPRKTENDS